MNAAIRYAKTFTEIQSNQLINGEWIASRVSEAPIDDMINEWVASTQSVIISVFPAVEHSSVQGDQYLTKVRYVVTYMDQETFQAYENSHRSVHLTTEEVSPGVQRVRKPSGGGPSQEEIAAAVAQVARSKAERGDNTPLPVNLQQIPTDAAIADRTNPFVGGRFRPPEDKREKQVSHAEAQPPQEVEELDSTEDAQPWQEAEGAAPEEARREAEALANELQTAIVEGTIPQKAGKRRGQKVVQNPTPPIQAANPNEGLGPEAAQKPQLPPGTLDGIPTRRRRR